MDAFLRELCPMGGCGRLRCRMCGTRPADKPASRRVARHRLRVDRRAEVAAAEEEREVHPLVNTKG